MVSPIATNGVLVSVEAQIRIPYCLQRRTAFILRSMSPGSAFSLSQANSGSSQRRMESRVISVGQKKISSPFCSRSLIICTVSSSSWACSMERTPARIAFFAPSRLVQWAMVILPQKFASDAAGASSSIVYCTEPGFEYFVPMPPVTTNLITSTPCLILRRVSFNTSSRLSNPSAKFPWPPVMEMGVPLARMRIAAAPYF